MNKVKTKSDLILHNDKHSLSMTYFCGQSVHLCVLFTRRRCLAVYYFICSRDEGKNSRAFSTAFRFGHSASISIVAVPRLASPPNAVLRFYLI